MMKRIKIIPRLTPRTILLKSKECLRRGVAILIDFSLPGGIETASVFMRTLFREKVLQGCGILSGIEDKKRLRVIVIDPKSLFNNNNIKPLIAANTLITFPYK